jgi:hypothetical protein
MVAARSWIVKRDINSTQRLSQDGAGLILRDLALL